MTHMPFVDISDLPILEPRPGWRGRFFHSDHMTFVHYAIDPGADVHAHAHDEEEVWHVLEGEIEMTLSGMTRVVGTGQAAVVPSGETHSVRALEPCRVIVVDYPMRPTVGGVDTGTAGLS